MENFLFYIGKSALAAGAFYIVYLVLFQNQKQFTFNRLYLPVSLALSFVIPLITFTKIQYLDAAPVSANSMAFLTEINQVNQTSEFQFEWFHYLFGIYIAGAIGFLSFLILGHAKAISIVKKSRLKRLFKIKVNITKKDVHPFSFFHKIVLSEQTLENPNLQLIVEHENIHVKEKHTFDILFSELMFLLQWFNPFAWLIKDAIKNNLEYKTDQKLTETHNPQAYQLAMVGLADKQGVAPFLTALNGSQLKNRIIMMKKKTENKYALIKQLVVLPLLAVLVMGLSNREVKTEIVQTEITVIQNVIKGKVTNEKGEPVAGVSILINGTIEGTKTDIKGSFEINSKEKIEKIFFGKNGYEEQNVNINDQKYLNVILKAEDRLYIVDGKIMENFEFDSIKPDDIENVSVLKNNSATDLYGEKGRNGVVVVTTKNYKKNSQGELPVVLNGKLTQLTLNEVDRDLIQNIKRIEPEEATKKYGKKGENGVFEITSRNVYTDMVKIKSSEELLEEKITSELELRKFIAKRIKYPIITQEKSLEGETQLYINISNKGIITDISKESQKADQVLGKVTVTAKKLDKSPPTQKNDDNEALKEDVSRVLKLTPEIEIPEFRGKTVEVAVEFVLQEDEKVKSSEELKEEKITSELALRKFIAKRIKYPLKVQQLNKGGIVQLFIQVDKNGEIKQIKESAEYDLLLEEVFVVAYKNKEEATISSKLQDANELLQDEVKRVIELIPEIDIPDFENKTVGITVKFDLQD